MAGSTSTRTVGSSAAMRVRPWTSLSSSVLDLAEMAVGSSRFGDRPRFQDDRGSRIRQGVARLGVAQPGDGDDIAGHRARNGGERRTDGAGHGSDPFVDVVRRVSVLVRRMAGELGEVAADVDRYVRFQDASVHRGPG